MEDTVVYTTDKGVLHHEQIRYLFHSSSQDLRQVVVALAIQELLGQLTAAIHPQLLQMYTLVY